MALDVPGLIFIVVWCGTVLVAYFVMLSQPGLLFPSCLFLTSFLFPCVLKPCMYLLLLFSPLPTNSLLHFILYMSAIMLLVVSMAVSGFVLLAGSLAVAWVELGVIGSGLGTIGA